MWRLWFVAIAISAAAHGAFAYWAAEREPNKPKKWTTIEMELAEVKPPPPPAPPPPPTPVPPPPVEPKKPILVKKVAHDLPPPPPPAPAEPLPEPPKVGVSEELTTATGGIAVQTGVTLDGTIGTGTGDRKLDKPVVTAPAGVPGGRPGGTGKKFVPIYEVTRLPKAKHAVEPEVPEAFRSAQHEALVVIEVEIDARGHVTGARVLRTAGFGLDEAALDAARRTEFEPALVGTQAVPVRYQIPYRFRVRG